MTGTDVNWMGMTSVASQHGPEQLSSTKNGTTFSWQETLRIALAAKELLTNADRWTTQYHAQVTGNTHSAWMKQPAAIHHDNFRQVASLFGLLNDAQKPW